MQPKGNKLNRSMIYWRLHASYLIGIRATPQSNQHQIDPIWHTFAIQVSACTWLSNAAMFRPFANSFPPHPFLPVKKFVSEPIGKLMSSIVWYTHSVLL